MKKDVKTMNPFKPARVFQNPHIQSIAASVKLRKPFVKRKAAPMLAASREVIVDGGNGVRLQGFHSPHPDGPRDLAILLHGWEGSHDSVYLLSLAGYLFNRGYDVFRLNMRDHGTSHHLNRELFHSCRLSEVLHGVQQVSTHYANGGKTFLCGFSLGGNFTLRIATKAPEAGLKLDKAVAVCPVLHPPSTLLALNKGWPVYNLYFIRKWKKSLLKKQALFPDIYDFNDPSIYKDLTLMTDYFVDRYTEYPDLGTYLNGYSLLGDVLKPLTVPAHIILSQDDPVVPFSDIERIARPESLTVTLDRKSVV
jgi:predicted alpha/beta-fold hydrolase